MTKPPCEASKIEKCLSRKEFCVCDITLKHPLFQNIPREETHKLNSFAEIIKYNAQQNIFYNKSNLSHIYFVLKGKVRLYSEDKDSHKEYIHRICDSGSALNAETLLGQKETFRCTAQCLEDSVIFAIEKISLKEFLTRNPIIAFNLASFLSDTIIEIEERARSFVLEEVTERLMHFLNQESLKHNSKQFKLKLAKAELAHYLGTIPSTLSKAFAHLEATNYISMEKSIITLEKVSTSP